MFMCDLVRFLSRCIFQISTFYKLYLSAIKDINGCNYVLASMKVKRLQVKRERGSVCVCVHAAACACVCNFHEVIVLEVFSDGILFCRYRLGISYPELTEMQARAIFQAAVSMNNQGITVLPEIMVPLVGTPQACTCLIIFFFIVSVTL